MPPACRWCTPPEGSADWPVGSPAAFRVNPECPLVSPFSPAVTGRFSEQAGQADQGESVGQDRFPTDGFDTTPSMLGGCDSSAPPSPPMITAGAIPALDHYRNQPVVGGYGTNDLDPNKFTQTKVRIVFHRHKKNLPLIIS